MDEHDIIRGWGEVRNLNVYHKRKLENSNPHPNTRYGGHFKELQMFHLQISE